MNFSWIKEGETKQNITIWEKIIFNLSNYLDFESFKI